MPEGDTIHRIARAMSRQLAGARIDSIETNDLGVIDSLAGRTIHSVHVHGKHLFINIDTGWTMRVHLGMHGRWHRHSAGDRQPSRPTARIVAGGFAWICTRAYRAEMMRTTATRTHALVTRLGPDILEDPPRIDEIVRRARIPAYAPREIGELIMDQRVAAGIGNVYKSETLFAARVHPRARLMAIGDVALTRVFEQAARLMRANLHTRRREAVPLRRRPQASSERLFVYGRAGKPCLDCGTIIRRFHQGDMTRSTYFCEGCQRDGVTDGAIP